MQISQGADIKKAGVSPQKSFSKAAGTYFSSGEILQLNKRYTINLFFKSFQGFT